MIIVALLTFFDGFSRLIALIGIEWEDNTTSTSTSGSTMCCNTSSTSAANENNMNPVLLEKIRTGKLIVGNELKQRQIAAQTSNNSSTTNITSNTNNTRKSESVTSKMRIGMADITQMTHFTEALIPTPQPRYRHLDSNNSSSHNNSYDVDLEIPDPSASSSSPYNLQHYSPYNTTSNTTGTNAGIVGSSTAEQIEIEKQRHSLFAYTGSRNKPTTTTTTGPSGSTGSSGGRNSSTRNPINTSTTATRDLFSIDNDDDDVYTGRYSDV